MITAAEIDPDEAARNEELKAAVPEVEPSLINWKNNPAYFPWTFREQPLHPVGAGQRIRCELRRAVAAWRRQIG
jgi:hypothetical protein